MKSTARAEDFVEESAGRHNEAKKESKGKRTYHKNPKTIKFLEGFKEKYDEGYSFYEIAEMYGIPQKTAAYYFNMIAEQNGIEKEKLLRKRKPSRKPKTIKFIEGFKEKYDEGYKFYEIADMYGMNHDTARHYLDEIVQKYGLQKEDVLERRKKGVKRSPEVEKYIEGYMEEYKKGYSAYKIGKIYGVSHSATLYYLDEIARNNGVTREEIKHVSRAKNPETIKFLEGFKEKYDEGYSFYEIADIYGINHDTAMYYLDEIVEKYGLKKEDVYIKRKRGAKRKAKAINFLEGFKEKYDEGYNFYEIASMYELPISNAIYYVDEIAEKYGLKRADLLISRKKGRPKKSI